MVKYYCKFCNFRSIRYLRLSEHVFSNHFKNFNEQNLDLNIFICHYTKLCERKKYILNELNKLDNIKYEFINEFDKENIDNNFFINNEEKWNLKTKKFYNFNFRLLKDSEKSLALKHYEALKKMIGMNLDYVLIIEDDCKFEKKFMSKLGVIYKNLPKDWDVYIPNSYLELFGYSDNKFILNPNNLVLKRNHPSTAYTLSYLIKKSAAIKIVNEIENNKISLPIDFEYNWLFSKLNLNVYWNNGNLPLIKDANFKSSIGH